MQLGIGGRKLCRPLLICKVRTRNIFSNLTKSSNKTYYKIGWQKMARLVNFDFGIPVQLIDKTFVLILFHVGIIYNFNFSVGIIDEGEVNNGDAKYLPRQSTGKCSPLFTESEMNSWYIINQRVNLKLEKNFVFFEKIIMSRFVRHICWGNIPSVF